MPNMEQHRVAAALMLAAASIAPAACIESKGGTEPDVNAIVEFRFRAELDPALANTTESFRLSGMRVELRESISREPITSGVLQLNADEPGVDPVAVVEVELPQREEIQVDGDIRLLGEDGSVQWSGVFGPTAIDTRTTTWPIVVDMGRGDLGNLTVSGVSLSEPEAIVQGQTVALDVSVGGGGHDLVVFWGVQDPTTATIDRSGNVTGVTPGETTVVAAAGKHSASVVVRVVAAGVAVRGHRMPGS